MEAECSGTYEIQLIDDQYIITRSGTAFFVYESDESIHAKSCLRGTNQREKGGYAQDLTIGWMVSSKTNGSTIGQTTYATRAASY